MSPSILIASAMSLDTRGTLPSGVVSVIGAGPGFISRRPRLRIEKWICFVTVTPVLMRRSPRGR